MNTLEKRIKQNENEKKSDTDSVDEYFKTAYELNEKRKKMSSWPFDRE